MVKVKHFARQLLHIFYLLANEAAAVHLVSDI